MYDKRIKIFIIIIAALLLVCLLRLAQMQLLTASSVQHEIAELKRQRAQTQQLKTLRGKILDRKGRVLALDRPRFYLCVNYNLSCYLDDRVRQVMLLKADRASKRTESNTPLGDMRNELEDKLDDLDRIIQKCAGFGLERNEIESKIKLINDRVWNLRTFLAWRRNNPDPNIIEKYGGKIGSVRLSEATTDLEKNFPDYNERLTLIGKVDDIAEMQKTYPLLELRTDDDIFTAQVEFLDVEGVEIQPEAQRFYPYGSAAAQTIGWVGLATQQQDKELFASDRLSSYLDDDVCGKRPGVEYVCETILRGRRGEVVYDIDSQLVSQTETQFGKDVTLTLDIELQQKIEDYLAEYPHEPNHGYGIAAVVIDVGTSDILALVSVPVFDLNYVREDYDRLISDPNRPMINRAINEHYPPGSAVKPLILIAGLQTGEITADEVINCPSQAAPPSWPDCLIFRRTGVGHDSRWENTARNAIKGSCNIYFSRLADRIESSALQQWLFAFGYGRDILSLPASFNIPYRTNHNRDFLQSPGIISSTIPTDKVTSPDQMSPIRDTEKRYFGIGQGNMRATPLQVANAMAAIARGGIYNPPRLFIDSETTSIEYQESPGRDALWRSIDLNILPETLDVVYDGMSAVVNESGGTANRVFAPVLESFAQQDVKIYGKTGSTERPEHAWFGGFAEDSTGRKLAIAVVVEGGQHGSSDAAPLARDIIWLFIEDGYIGKHILIDR
jgi:penicillin-binding protein 2